MQGTECDLRLRSVFCHCVPELFNCDILGHIGTEIQEGQDWQTRQKREEWQETQMRERQIRDMRDKRRETGLKVTCERRFLQILRWFSHFLDTHYPWWTMDIALTSAAPVRLERQRFPSTRFTWNRRLSSDKGRLWHYGGTWVQQKLNKIPLPSSLPVPFSFLIIMAVDWWQEKSPN